MVGVMTRSIKKKHALNNAASDTDSDVNTQYNLFENFKSKLRFQRNSVSSFRKINGFWNVLVGGEVESKLFQNADGKPLRIHVPVQTYFSDLISQNLQLVWQICCR